MSPAIVVHNERENDWVFFLYTYTDIKERYQKKKVHICLKVLSLNFLQVQDKAKLDSLIEEVRNTLPPPDAPIPPDPSTALESLGKVLKSVSFLTNHYKIYSIYDI